jgi:hypothetical protein
LVSLLPGLAILFLLAAAPQTGQASRERMYVAVADAGGRAVTGLSADDFFVEIDGVRQEILSARPAAEPASVVLLTDQLGVSPDYRPGDLQHALGAFIEAIRTTRPDSQFALTTFDGIVVQAAPFGTAPSAIDRRLDRLTVPGSDAPLVDALTDACRMARAAPTPRRAIFLVFAAYRPDQGNPRPDIAGTVCRQSDASVWTIEARASDGRNYPSPAREAVVNQVSRSSGGLHEVVTTSEQLASVAQVMGGLVAGQYAVTYGPGGGAAQSRRTVGVRGTDVYVLAPSWVNR